jgi:iron complex transport system substrate-binding protein
MMNSADDRTPLTRRTFMRLTAYSAIGAFCASLLPGCSGFSSQGNLRNITDMGNRRVMVPEQISRVFCTNPIGTVDMFGLAPEMLVGWNFRPAGDNKKYIPDEYFALPSLGVWMGSGSVPNAEEIAKQDPDVLLCYWTADDVGANMADEVQNQTGLPVVLVDYDLRHAPEMYRFVGGLIGIGDRSEELATFCERKLAMISEIAQAIPEASRKRIFLAQGNEGLTTDPVGSMHVTDALSLICTENVADMPGTEGQGMGMPSVNLEQIIEWNPDAVLVAEFNMSDSESSDIYGAIKDDDHWKNVPCVAAGEIYRIPQSPFSWFGRPPSVVRLLGCLWLLKVLYPEYSSAINMRDETIEFYKVFYRYEKFDDYTLTQLLGAAGIDAKTGEKA